MNRGGLGIHVVGKWGENELGLPKYIVDCQSTTRIAIELYTSGLGRVYGESKKSTHCKIPLHKNSAGAYLEGVSGLSSICHQTSTSSLKVLTSIDRADDEV